jgi:malonyl-CoA O-methyltransferase
MSDLPLSRAACAELLDRLDHFALRPRVVLDLCGGVTDGARDALRRRFPSARIVVTGPLACAAGGAPVPSVDHAAPGGLTRRALDALRRLIPGSASAVERIDAAPDHLPLVEGSVDLVLGHWLAPGIESVDAVLAELRRVLAPGGLFLWTTPGLGATREPIDLHDLGGALARAGFLEPVLDVDRYGAAYEIIHASAFAGAAPRAAGGSAVVLPAESLVSVGAIGRRRDRSDPGGRTP